MFPLGVGSKWNNNELKYSLRSIEKHVSGVRNIYIIGHLPSFVKNVIYIPFEDTGKCKETNIYNKVVRACQEPDISEDFLFFNDDHFILQDVVGAEFPIYHKGDLVTVVHRLKPGNRYRRCVERTMRTLHALGYRTNNFDIHSPIIYNKSKFLYAMDRYDWTPKYTFVVKSLYANTLGIDGVKEFDCKLNANMVAEEIYRYINDKKFFSIGDKAVCDQMTLVLDSLYPTPSKWEN